MNLLNDTISDSGYSKRNIQRNQGALFQTHLNTISHVFNFESKPLAVCVDKATSFAKVMAMNFCFIFIPYEHFEFRRSMKRAFDHNVSIASTNGSWVGSSAAERWSQNCKFSSGVAQIYNSIAICALANRTWVYVSRRLDICRLFIKNEISQIVTIDTDIKPNSTSQVCIRNSLWCTIQMKVRVDLLYFACNNLNT